MSASSAPPHRPVEANPRADEPGRDAVGDRAPIASAGFAQMDAGQRLSYLRGLLAEAGAVNTPAVEDWRRRNAPGAPSAEPTPISILPAPAAPAKTKPKSAAPRRIVKTLLGLALVVAVGYAPVQRMAQTTSVEAIVNARVITLRAPIDGEVQAGPIVRGSGAALAAGDVLFRVVDPRADRNRVDDLSRQLGQARDERPRLAARLESARTLLADLSEQTRAFGAARIHQLEARRDALTADAAVAHARALDATATLERANRLLADGAGTPVQANLAKRDADIAAQNEISAQGLIVVNDVELASARRGVFVSDSYNDRPTSAQRADDLGQQIGDFEQALNESDRRVARLSQDLDDEQARYAQLASAAIVAPAKGSVWEVLTAPGEQVRRGQELVRVLDCGGALVTATVSESVYNRLHMGSPARFQPRDGSEDLAGTVIGLTGSSTTPANFAILPAALARGAYHVTVSVPGLANAQTCDVGRTGQVIFDAAHADLIDALRPGLW
ncbi:MAG: HlyD family secretion protein [Bradyrhizobium sp.]|nr:MAG: HlyD family secretion protein [Bradyrhizobium sp.]